MEKIKKISLILVVLLTICLYQKTYATLSCNPSITSTLEVTEGEEFEVSIGINNIQGDRGVLIFGGTVEYDRKVLTCVEQNGEKNWSLSYNDANGKFVADRNNGFATSNETVLKLKFKVNENATGKTTITVKETAVSNAKELIDTGVVSKTISIEDKEDEDENQGGNENQGSQGGNTIQGGNTNQGSQGGNTIQGGNTNQGSQGGNTIQGGNENQGSQGGNTVQGGNANQGSQGGNANQTNTTNNNKINTTTKKPTTTNKTNTNNVNNTNFINNTIIETNTIDNNIDNSIIDESNTIRNEVDVFSNEEDMVQKYDTKSHKKNNSFMVMFGIFTIGVVAVIGGVFFARNKPNFKIKFKVDK